MTPCTTTIGRVGVEPDQYTVIRYAERLPDAGAIGSVGDNALEIVGLYKTECVKIDRPFRTADELELATLSWGALVQLEPAAIIDRIPHTHRERDRVLP